MNINKPNTKSLVSLYLIFAISMIVYGFLLVFYNYNYLIGIYVSLKFVHFSFYIIILFLLYVFFVPTAYLSVFAIYRSIWTRCNLNKYSIEVRRINNEAKMPDELPWVCMTHSICNDFSPNNLKQLLLQDYQKVKYFILDDSSIIEQIDAINDFAKQNSIVVIRRPNDHKDKYRSKGGNLLYFVNNYSEQFEYLVSTESTSILQNDYISRNIRFFFNQENIEVGAVAETGIIYPKKTLFSSIVSFSFEYLTFANSFDAIIDGIITPYGWASMFDITTLKALDINLVNVVVDDIAEGILISKTNKKVLYSQIGWNAKSFPADFDSFKAQRIKWMYGDISLIKNQVMSFKNFSNKKNAYKNAIFWKISTNIVLPIAVVLNFTFNFVLVLMEYDMWNLFPAQTFMSILTFIFIAGSFLVTFLFTCNFFRLIILMFGFFITMLALYFCMVPTIIIAAFSNKKIKHKITSKTTHRLTLKEFFKKTMIYFLLLVIIVTLFSVIFYVMIINNYHINYFAYWLNIIFVMMWPISMIISYFFCLFGYKNGFDDDQQNIDLDKNFFNAKPFKKARDKKSL